MNNDYPRPRYPSIKPIPKSELISRIKKFIVDPDARSKTKAGFEDTGRTHTPVYDVKKGEKVLVVGASEYDLDVIDAYAIALREKGAKVDLMIIDLGKLGSPEDAAAAEASSLIPGEDNPVYSRYCNVIMSEAANGLVKAEGYDMIIGGMGPPPETTKTKWRRLMYIYNEEIASPRIEFPQELQFAIDRKVWDQITNLEKCRITDPEGTDISWTNYDDKRLMVVGHEFGKPAHIGYGGKADCSGVVAGTLNHVGAFPNIKAHLRDDLVVKVEGGGRYGDVWREKIEELNKLQLPDAPLHISETPTKMFKLPGPGFFWYWEMAIGTSPKAFRHPRESKFECFANFLHDRSRAGYLHSGFGAPSGTQISYSKLGIPWTHVHIHSMFATFEGRTRDGTGLKVIDKGKLTALDDPEIRKLASRFGDPDDLLQEIWIPALPGVNVEGDYLRDYGKSPYEWIRKEARALNEPLVASA
jgi:hypothetical protein